MEENVTENFSSHVLESSRSYEKGGESNKKRQGLTPALIANVHHANPRIEKASPKDGVLQKNHISRREYEINTICKKCTEKDNLIDELETEIARLKRNLNEAESQILEYVDECNTLRNTSLHLSLEHEKINDKMKKIYNGIDAFREHNKIQVMRLFLRQLSIPYK
jgi:chromosome segregation ATPase